jgi:tRNA(fMet)-specific endonuclease VapC
VGILIDTSVLIAHERGELSFEKWIEGREDEPFYLSVISASELLHGVHRARDPGVRARRSAFVEGVLEAIPLLPIEVAAARMHARLWAELAAAGRMIGAHDLWLAASALTHGLTVVTGDPRDFSQVPGLLVEVWGEG